MAKSSLLPVCVLLLSCVCGLRVDPFIVVTQGRSMSTLVSELLHQPKIGFFDMLEWVKKDSRNENLVTKWKKAANATGPVDPTQLAFLVAKFYHELENTNGLYSPFKKVVHLFHRLPPDQRIKVGFKMRMLDIAGASDEEENTKLLRFIKSLHDISNLTLKCIFLHREPFSQVLSRLEATATSVFHPERLSESEFAEYLHRSISIDPQDFVKECLAGCRRNRLAFTQLRDASLRFPDAAEYIDVPSENVGSPFLREATMREIISFLLRTRDNPSGEWRGMPFEEVFGHFLTQIRRPATRQGRSVLPLSMRVANAKAFLDDSLYITEGLRAGGGKAVEQGCLEELESSLRKERGKLIAVDQEAEKRTENLK